jgi:tetratricopeptide (TPR) repeat protein
MLSPSYVDRVTVLGHLSTALITRFKRLGAIQDLRDAKKYSNNAMLKIEKERFPDAQTLNTFSTMLARKYHCKRDVRDLDRAIEFAQNAIDAKPPNHANQRRNMCNLASCLANRYKVNRDRADIKEALEISYQNLKIVPIDHSNQLMMLSNHVCYLLQQLDPNDIDKAIRIGCITIKEATEKTPLLTQLRRHVG